MNVERASGPDARGPLGLVRLAALMERTRGRAEIAVALIDGPISRSLAAFPEGRIREAPGARSAACAAPSSAACRHATFVASILAADRDAGAPGICSGCTLITVPIFSEAIADVPGLPTAAPGALAEAIVDALSAGARILNLSLAVVRASAAEERQLGLALDAAVASGALVVAAAGNHGAVGSSVVTRHPWVIPVVACDLAGSPMSLSDLGGSIGRHGLSAPGEGMIGLDPEGKPATATGTSVAAAVVTGAAALVWSELPRASAATIRLALAPRRAASRRSVVPPLLDAWGAYQILQQAREYREG